MICSLIALFALARAEEVPASEPKGGHQIRSMRVAFGLQTPAIAPDDPNVLTRGFFGLDAVPVFWGAKGFVFRPTAGWRYAQGISRLQAGLELGVLHRTHGDTHTEILDGEAFTVWHDVPLDADGFRESSLCLRFDAQYAFDGSDEWRDALSYDFGLSLAHDDIGFAALVRVENNNSWFVLEAQGITYWAKRATATPPP
jgi:hypothetical protein